MSTAWMLISVSGFGTAFGGSCASFGGVAAGSVIMSRLGRSAFCSGLPSLPSRPRRPGPGTFNHTMSDGLSSTGSVNGGVPGRLPMMNTASKTPPMCVNAEAMMLLPNRPSSSAPCGTVPARKRALGLVLGSGASFRGSPEGEGTVAILVRRLLSHNVP
jgi:hypothetical protein